MRKILVLFFIGCMTLMCTGMSVRPRDKKDVRAEKETPASNMAPDFTLQDLRKQVFSLSVYKQKNPVLIFFWTTWCPFCQEELKNLNNKFADFLKEGIVVFAVNVGEPQSRVGNFIQKRGYIFNVLVDEDTEVAQRYGIFGVPTYALINKAGQVVYQDNYFPLEYKNLLREQKKNE